jgi:AraC-like DNA-binding protein
MAPGAGKDRDRVASLSTLDLCAWQEAGHRVDEGLDWLVFGQSLPVRTPDSRIADVVMRIRSDPALAWQAADAASHCSLSTSRFMHLFKAEMGIGWRAFRAWKRARGLLGCVHGGENLTQLALALGYPDGTHFSHAIRQITGLRPSDIISGSRHLSVWNESGVSPA